MDAATVGRGAGDLGKDRRSRRNLALRMVSSLAALLLMYLALDWDMAHASSGGWAWAVLVAAMTIPCLREFYRLARAGRARPFAPVGYVLGPLWLLAFEWELSGGRVPAGAGFAFLVAAALSAMLLQLTRKTNDDALIHVSATVFGLVYCCLLGGFTIPLRHLELSPGGWPAQGTEFVVSCIFVTKVSDVGALLVGSRLGKRRLIPRLSPGKTWEGAIGGLFSSLILLQFMALTAPDMALAGLGPVKLALLSFLLSAGGMAGDLVESAFKRSGEMKDAGSGVPGFGGALDLLDSLFVAAPTMYLFLLFCGARAA